MIRRVLPLLLLLVLVVVGSGGVAQAAEPPDQDDPCSRAGRNVCGTNGKGSYRDYKFGVRWFGDFRGAVRGITGPTFCIDLRFWYPSRDFRFEKRSAAGLKNRDGDSVSASDLRRMSYALWRFGRSDRTTQQAAVMLYVHRLMGDGAPGEVDPGAISAASRSLYRRIEREAERYGGPYKVEAALPERLVAGAEAEVTVRVVSASGRAVPGVDVELGATGATGLPSELNTGASGVAKLKFTPDDPRTGVKIDVRAADLPADLPTLYVPTQRKAARNGQRLIAPAAVTERAEVNAPVRAAPRVVTQISAPAVVPGTAVTDTVKVEGLAGQTVTVQAALYGPFAARDQIKCDTPPVWTGSFVAAADGDYVTEPVTLSRPGYYTYRESIAESPTVAAVETPCAEAAETTIVRGTPAITTQVSAQETAPGAQITDTAVVSGLGTLAATVAVELWGPFPSREAISCEGTPFWKGTFAANGDGSYTTEAVTLTKAGYYTYRESIAATEAYDAVVTPCGEVTETTLAKAAPKVTTVVSSTAIKPGTRLFDRIKVSGLGETPATVEVELFGPYASREEIDCEGAPFWKGTVEAKGDGEIASPKVTVRRVGFYTYRERIAGSETTAATETECGIVAETSLGRPLILTGRGDEHVAHVRAAQDDDVVEPTRVRVDRLGIDAQVSGVGIDMRAGALGTPSDIDRVGWWRDGAAPGASAGSILLAGHVDSAKRGAGAFYALKTARRGDRIELVSDDGRTRRFRVTSVRTMRKAELPENIYTRSGPRRLVLVTCGGPFNSRAGNYRDNVVVTAVPL
jgi:hypothetical protein